MSPHEKRARLAAIVTLLLIPFQPVTAQSPTALANDTVLLRTVLEAMRGREIPSEGRVAGEDWLVDPTPLIPRSMHQVYDSASFVVPESTVEHRRLVLPRIGAQEIDRSTVRRCTGSMGFPGPDPSERRRPCFDRPVFMVLVSLPLPVAGSDGPVEMTVLVSTTISSSEFHVRAERSSEGWRVVSVEHIETVVS